MSETTRANYYPNTLKSVAEKESETVANAETGTVIGGGIGITMGAIMGIALAIGSNVIIPGAGLFIAGPLIAGLAGAGTGAITGGLIGALIGVGFEPETAQIYEASLSSGQILLGVHPKNDDKEAIKIAWEAIGASDIKL
jgi:hypothetical protein